MDNLKIRLQLCGDIRQNHVIYDVLEGRFISNIACFILIVGQAAGAMERV